MTEENPEDVFNFINIVFTNSVHVLNLMDFYRFCLCPSNDILDIDEKNVSFVNICEKIDCAITAPHCISYTHATGVSPIGLASHFQLQLSRLCGKGS